MTLAEMNDEFGAARTNKREFLEKMDSIIPWVELKHYRLKSVGLRAKALFVATESRCSV